MTPLEAKAAKVISKEVLDTALTFMRDGLPFQQAIRAGHNIMQEPIHPDVMSILNREAKSRIGNVVPYEVAPSVASWQDAMLMDKLRSGNYIPSIRQTMSEVAKPEVMQPVIRQAAGREYALRQLLDLAAQGDEAARAALIQSGGLNWMSSGLA